MKDAKCADTNGKSIFWYLVFEIWSFFYSKLVNFSLNFEYKIDHISKNNNLISHYKSFQLIPHLFCKFDHFWIFFLVGDTLENPTLSPVKNESNSERRGGEAVIEIWSILSFTFVMHSWLRRIQNFFYVWWAPPP